MARGRSGRGNPEYGAAGRIRTLDELEGHAGLSLVVKRAPVEEFAFPGCEAALGHRVVVAVAGRVTVPHFPAPPAEGRRGVA